jgi:cytochrome c-type biogenesis protein
MTDLKLPEPIRSLSVTQRLLLVVLAAIVVLIIIGSLFQPDTAASSNQLIVGIQSQPFAVLAALAFAAGLLSFVSPCTLPVLTAYFAFAFQSDRSRIAANTIAFMAGMGITFSLFGAVGFALGRVLLQNQQLILLIGGSFILIFGVMMLLGIGFAGVAQNSAIPQSATMRGSFAFGLTFSVGWTGCIGPILGSVMGLAAQTGSALQGMFLLFIYTLGLGLPLFIVSVLFGRSSRQSWFWRVLRGKGWQWDTHVFVVALIWALAAWRILAAAAQYAYWNFAMFEGMRYTAVQEIGLLLFVVLGAVLWTFTSGQKQRQTVYLHSTQLISGALFIIIGILMLEARMAYFNEIIPVWLYEYIAAAESFLLDLFGN